MANAYGVIPPNRPPDRQFAQRWTFYIDPNGKITAIDKEVKPATAGEAVVAKLLSSASRRRRRRERTSRDRLPSHYTAARRITDLHAAVPITDPTVPANPSTVSTLASAVRPARLRDSHLLVSVRTLAAAVSIACATACAVVILRAATPPVLNEPLVGRQVFPTSNWWNTDITSAPVDARSAALIDFISGRTATNRTPISEAW